MAKATEPVMEEVEKFDPKCPRCQAGVSDGITVFKVGTSYEPKRQPTGETKAVAVAKFINITCAKCGTQTNMVTPI